MHLVVYIVVEANWDCLKQYVPTKYKSGLEYVNGMKMAYFSEWVMEIELFVCAQFTGQDVIVYTRHGWLCYKQNGMGGKQMKVSFFLTNPNGCHFNPIVGMKPEGKSAH